MLSNRTISALLIGVAQAHWPEADWQPAYREDYASWAALFGEDDDQYSGYEWDVFTTTAKDENGQDEWELSFFRILPAANRRIANSDIEWAVVNNGRSVLMMHGQGQDAETWLTGYFVGNPLPLMLVDDGYTVYMGNNRGTKFSKNLQREDTSSEEYWDFDFTDMGTKDLPAIIHSIKSFDVLQLNYIGYDMGNMQLFYGLTQIEDFFFRLHLANFIALAPCVLPASQQTTILSYETSVGAYRGLGVYAINGPNWATDLEKICSSLNQYACQEAKEIAEDANGVPISVKNLEYLRQLSITQRYQVYATSEVFNAQNEQPLIEAEFRPAYQPSIEVIIDSGLQDEVDII